MKIFSEKAFIFNSQEHNLNEIRSEIHFIVGCFNKIISINLKAYRWCLKIFVWKRFFYVELRLRFKYGKFSLKKLLNSINKIRREKSFIAGFFKKVMQESLIFLKSLKLKKYISIREKSFIASFFKKKNL